MAVAFPRLRPADCKARRASPHKNRSYENGLVGSGRTYFYVVTALDQAGRESRFSAKCEPRFPELVGA